MLQTKIINCILRKQFIIKMCLFKKHPISILYKYPKPSRDSKIYSDKVFISINSGGQGGSHWCVFYVENNKSFSFG